MAKPCLKLVDVLGLQYACAFMSSESAPKQQANNKEHTYCLPLGVDIQYLRRRVRLKLPALQDKVGLALCSPLWYCSAARQTRSLRTSKYSPPP